mmetsp:Transcript_47848/g.137251  ORF Transcript_47848/g.137251 Transcript_47848/m.137251 type:complete len:216 (-) Transcript_47848:310-957(-)
MAQHWARLSFAAWVGAAGGHWLFRLRPCAARRSRRRRRWHNCLATRRPPRRRLWRDCYWRARSRRNARPAPPPHHQWPHRRRRRARWRTKASPASTTAAGARRPPQRRRLSPPPDRLSPQLCPAAFLGLPKPPSPFCEAPSNAYLSSQTTQWPHRGTSPTSGTTPPSSGPTDRQCPRPRSAAGRRPSTLRCLLHVISTSLCLWPAALRRCSRRDC